jgi:hypothetical protein
VLLAISDGAPELFPCGAPFGAPRFVPVVLLLVPLICSCGAPVGAPRFVPAALLLVPLDLLTGCSCWCP